MLIIETFTLKIWKNILEMIRHVPIDDLKDFGDNGQDTGWSIVIFLWTSSFFKKR